MSDASDQMGSGHPGRLLRQSSLHRFRDDLKQVAVTLQPKHLRQRFDESDVVQEALLSADQSFSQFHGRTKNELFRWLCAILENRFYDLCRHHKRQKRDIRRESPIEQFALHPPANPEKLLDQGALTKALQTLCPRTQTVIAMKSFENKTYDEIAAHLGCSSEAARKLWERGIKTLKQAIPDGHDDRAASNPLS